MSTPRLINLKGTWINPAHVTRVVPDGAQALVWGVDEKRSSVAMPADEVATIINKELARAEAAARTVIQV